MAKQFLDEGRGPLWVTPNGTLLLREAQLYGPNYPGKGPSPPPPPPHNATMCTGQKLSAGQALVFEPAQHKEPVAFCQDFSLQAAGAEDGANVAGASSRGAESKSKRSSSSSSSSAAAAATTSRLEQRGGVAVSTQGQLRLLVSWGLCIGVPACTVGGLSSTDGTPVVLVDCRTDSAVVWSMTVNNTAPSHVNPQAVHRIGSGPDGCLTAPDAVGEVVSIASCVDRSAAQQWVFGTGGRLCVPMGCVSVRPS
jgi:hypothetical protein